MSTQVPIERLKELAGKIIAEHQADILTEPLAVGAIKAELRFAARSGMIAALRELISLRGQSEWQPIETAPKDGTDVLLWGRCCGEIHGEYDADCAVVASYQCDEWHATVGDCYSTTVKPTRWMPLPEPPQS